MKEVFDVVVVGSGAGGGVVAGELAQRGRAVLLLEAGPHRTAADFMRWEAHANHDIWWPLRLAPLPDGDVVAFLAGRCVGGTTTINTKVALRAHERDVAKWYAASGLTNDDGEPFAASELDPYYDRVEQVLGVRERTDWPKSVHTVEPGFKALGVELEPVTAYTDPNCMRCGSCLQGCATNAGKSTMNTYIHDALAGGRLELRAEAVVDRVLIEDSRADWCGVRRQRWGAPASRSPTPSSSPGARSTLRSCSSAAGSTTRTLVRHLGLHPVRLVYGLFDEPQDAHMVYPITAHCMDFQHDEEGGFVIEATTIQDPISFATTLRDEQGPFWGPRLVEAVRGFRNWIGLLALVNDENGSSVVVDEDGGERFDVDFEPVETERHRRVARLQPPGARGRGCEAVLLDRPRVDARPGQLPDGRRPGAIGGRPQRRVARRQAALRRRLVAHPAHVVREPVADDHGARDEGRRAHRRRPEWLPLCAHRHVTTAAA